MSLCLAGCSSCGWVAKTLRSFVRNEISPFVVEVQWLEKKNIEGLEGINANWLLSLIEGCCLLARIWNWLHFACNGENEWSR